ncbi:MAG: LLM class F420-dependent oxidoreductase [Myxococcota bacterium]
MELGFSSMNTPFETPPAELARALEERGYDSLFIGEHSHIPVSRDTPYPAGGEMPEPYRWMMDPFVSLTVAATATKNLKLGLGVALPLEHDIFDLAKTAATVDRMSGGRLLFGVGVGWNVEELANIRPSVPWKKRFSALRESVHALRALWCDEESEYHGEFFDFDPVWSLPKPLQDPHPPIMAGYSGKLGTKHAVEWADGWMPMDAGLGNVPKKVGLFRDAVKEAGREHVPITMVAFGDPDYDTLASYADLGIERATVGIARKGWEEGATPLEFLDRYAEMIPRLRR